ncbi:DNA-directed RNA polymerase subunit L [Candidatus Woesearchaeota archaeon]|jgi:DNA-directed RNA polymerase subunit L|nr:DNA-directed RNA polymerase subunit L [Candidatus Woesearchaeota archaeon]MBT6518232.1 DNA-directed RNA polymerase subunit L [Candidatus Woesearchaeota archaeon]MBT7368634.1 DNA-directed RNA polymerase subunit L [Candidatus Woesearchaeota archaeon]
MEIDILEESKNRLVFELNGESHGICNALKKQLWQTKGVKLAGYTITHPLVGAPRIIIETESKLDPKKAVAEACKQIKKDIDAFEKKFVKEVK